MSATSSYLSHWQLSKPVFIDQVAPENLYISSTLEPLVRRAILFAQQGGGLIVWSGQKGSGRSSLAKLVYQSVDLMTTEPLLLTMVQNETTAGWLIGRLANLFCPKEKGRAKSPENAFKDLARHFESVLGEGRGLALFIDAAENLRSIAALSEISSLLNLQSLAAGRLSVSLFGTEQIAELCKSSPAMAARTLCHLSVPLLEPNQVSEYIAHRCKLAGLTPQCFEPTTHAYLASASGGLISRLNTLAENSLIEASEMKLGVVNQKAVMAALQYLDGAPKGNKNQIGEPGIIPHTTNTPRNGPPLASLFRTPSPAKTGKKEDE